MHSKNTTPFLPRSTSVMLGALKMGVRWFTGLKLHRPLTIYALNTLPAQIEKEPSCWKIRKIRVNKHEIGLTRKYESVCLTSPFSSYCLSPKGDFKVFKKKREKKMQKKAAGSRGIEFYLRSISAVHVAFSYTQKSGRCCLEAYFFFFILLLLPLPVLAQSSQAG